MINVAKWKVKLVAIMVCTRRSMKYPAERQAVQVQGVLNQKMEHAG